MSNLLRIYREHALELLYEPWGSSKSTYKSIKATDTSIDLRVLSQQHPGFPLYILMSGVLYMECHKLMDQQKPKPPS